MVAWPALRASFLISRIARVSTTAFTLSQTLNWRHKTISQSLFSSGKMGQRPTTANPNPHTNAVTSRNEEGNEKDNIEYTSYEILMRKLYQANLAPGYSGKVDLENITKIHELLGNPMDKITVVHIAGTNGKGSVTLKIAKALEACGTLKVGLFCSPHLFSFRERMQINGKLISEDQIMEYLPRIFQLCEEHSIPASFFEISTALAFYYYAEQKVDVVCLETGLGGRLDATNVVEQPALSIITSIGLEHTKFLGETVEEIAVQKGGIIKQGRPVLCGPNVPHNVLRACAVEKRASQYYTCEDVLGKSTTVISDYDEENKRTARAALQILEDSKIIPKLTPIMIEQGVCQRPPCRFETMTTQDGVTVVMDVAHNREAMQYLLRKLKENFLAAQKFRFIVGMSYGKDLGQCARLMLEATSEGAIHVVEAYHPRAAKLEMFFEAEPRLCQSAIYNLSDRSITRQMQPSLQIAKEQHEVLVICGSGFLMAEARIALGFDEPRDTDYIAEVAGAHIRRRK